MAGRSARVVRDDQVRAFDERVRGRDVDVAPVQVVVGQAGQGGDFRVERATGVLEVGLGLVVQDLGDAPVVDGVAEGEHCDLDDLVALDAEPGGLAVDVEPAAQLR